MEENTLLQLGVGGLFAYVIIKEVLNFLRSRNGNGNGHSTPRVICGLGRNSDSADFDSIVRQIGNLWEMYFTVDPSDGTTQFGRYVRKAMQDAGLSEILATNKRQEVLLTQILRVLSNNTSQPGNNSTLDDTGSFRRAD